VPAIDDRVQIYPSSRDARPLTRKQEARNAGHRIRGSFHVESSLARLTIDPQSWNRQHAYAARVAIHLAGMLKGVRASIQIARPSESRAVRAAPPSSRNARSDMHLRACQGQSRPGLLILNSATFAETTEAVAPLLSIGWRPGRPAGSGLNLPRRR